MSKASVQFIELIRQEDAALRLRSLPATDTRLNYCNGCGEETLHTIREEGKWERWYCNRCPSHVSFRTDENE